MRCSSVFLTLIVLLPQGTALLPVTASASAMRTMGSVSMPVLWARTLMLTLSVATAPAPARSATALAQPRCVCVPSREQTDLQRNRLSTVLDHHASAADAQGQQTLVQFSFLARYMSPFACRLSFYLSRNPPLLLCYFFNVLLV